MNDIKPTSDNGVVLIGNRNYWDYENDKEIALIRADKSGNILWKEFYGGEFWDNANGVVHTSANKYIITGSTEARTNILNTNQQLFIFEISK